MRDDIRCEHINPHIQQEQDLRQSYKMESIGILAGGVAHDFNNILTVIIGACTMLEMQVAGNPKQMPFVSRIRSYAERATQLTQDLLAFSRTQTIFPRSENLTDVFREILGFLAKIVGKDIRFSTQLPENALMVMIDRGQIEQVMMNLAAHSRDAMPRGGVLNIALSQIRNDGSVPELAGYGVGDYALIAVSDTGIGIGRDTLRRMFEPYFTTRELGAGLGLFVAHGVITRHGGVIHVRSDPGQGTTFEIYLPLCDQGECAISENTGLHPPDGTET